MKIHGCGTDGKIWSIAALKDFIDIIDDIVGLGEPIIRCDEAEIVQVL